jgi:hypothetical protein
MRSTSCSGSTASAPPLASALWSASSWQHSDRHAPTVAPSRRPARDRLVGALLQHRHEIGFAHWLRKKIALPIVTS